MKIPVNRSIPLLLLCLASAWIGWLLGLPDSTAEGRDGTESRSEPRRPGRDASAAAGIRPSGPKARTPQQFAALKKSLMSRFMESPYAWEDWELREQTAAILATLTTEELKDFADSLGKSGLDRFVTFTKHPGGQSALLREILLQWGLRDPAAAVLCEVSHEHSAAGNHVLRAWLERAPGEAEAWVFSDDFPTGYESISSGLRALILEEKAAHDFGAALDLWSGFQAADRTWGIRNFVDYLEKDPSKIADLVAKIAAQSSSGQAMSDYRTLISSLAGRSADQAAALIETLPVSDEDRRALAVNWAEGWAMKSPAEAFAYWASLGEESPSSTMVDRFSMWASRDPAKAGAWVAGLEAGPARHRFEEKVVSQLMGMGDFGRAADFSKIIPDPEQRLRQLKIVHRGWQERNPRAAGEWLAKLPEADRAALGGD